MRRMLAMAEHDHKDDPELAGALAGLGYSLAQQKRYAESEPFFQRAIAIIEKAKGPADLFLAQLLSYQAGVLNGLGHPADAEPLVHRALAIVEQASGADDREMILPLNTLLGILTSQKRSADAVGVRQQLLRVTEKAAGPNSLPTADVLTNLALALEGQENHTVAEPVG